MTRVALLGKGLNNGGWHEIITLLDPYGCDSVVFTDHTEVTIGFDLGIIIGYTRIVTPETLAMIRSGFVLFHSSDLPQGRGWAPIYYTIIQGLDLVQTMLFASQDADAGDIIAKARYPLAGTEVEQEVREIDDLLTLALLRRTLPDLVAGTFRGKPQNHEAASWWPRRRPEHSSIDPACPIREVFDHLRAVPSSAPAFVEISGRIYDVILKPRKPLPIDQKRISLDIYYSTDEMKFRG